MFVCVRLVHTHMCAYGSQVLILGVFLNHSPPCCLLFFPLLRWASLNPEFTDLARLMASEHQESSISASPAVELQICIIKLSL